MGFMSRLLRYLRRSKDVVPSKEPVRPADPVIFDEDHRRHRVDAPYLLPKDLSEVNRLDYQHYIFRRILQDNSFAPVHDQLLKEGNILDVGCGTGRWCYEIAAAYPRTQVFGLDLEAVPRRASAPLNYTFHQGNVLHGLPFAGRPFYYTHQRLLVAGVPWVKWPGVIEELRSVTALGGWIELVEMGNTFHRLGPATTQFLKWWVAISSSRGIDGSKMGELAPLLKEVGGLAEIKSRTITVPLGSWGGSLGAMLAADILAGWPTLRPIAHALLNVPPKQFDTIINQLESEWNTYQTSYDLYFYCARVVL